MPMSDAEFDVLAVCGMIRSGVSILAFRRSSPENIRPGRAIYPICPYSGVGGRMVTGPSSFLPLLILLLACSLTGCALHHSGQLRAPRVGAVPPIAVAAMVSGQIVCAPQAVSKVLEEWECGGCPGKAVSIWDIYNIAAAHGVSYIDPITAATILATKTTLGWIIEGASYAALGVSIASSWNLFHLNSTWQKIGSGSGGLGLLIPALQRNIPTALCNDQDLLVNSLGCGGVMFCSQPSAVGAFTEVVK